MKSSRPFADSAELIRSPVLRCLYGLIQPVVERLFRIDEINAVYRKLKIPGITPREFCEKGLALLGSSIRWPDDAAFTELRRAKGPLVVMANHPFGAADSLALMLLLEKVRPGGWRLLSNRTLSRAPELAPHLIAVEPFEPSAPVNRSGLREARRYLAAGGIVAAFPAGRVSGRNLEKTGPLDLLWSDHLARLASSAGAAVALVYFHGQNSPFFMRVPLRWPKLRALFLAREILRPDKSPLRFEIGPVLDPGLVATIVRRGRAGAKLHARCHLLAEIQPAPIDSPTSQPPAIAPAVDPSAMQAEVEHLTSGEGHLFTQGRFAVMLWQRHEAPQLFQELSRLREITFRASGQGGGSSVDITPEDDYYHQLVLWDNEQLRLVGAYRLGITREVLAQRGQHALYLDHVFHIKPAFLEQIGPAIELTRSFIHPDYQREPLALSHLWRGLGQVCAQRGIRSLFGSVTIPASVSESSRAIIVEHLRRHHMEDETLSGLIKARCPFQPPGIAHRLVADAHADDPIESLRDTIRTPEGTPCRIPPLIRHYLSMNARFLDFHVESEFGNALYCLLRVDLAKVPRSHLRRFVGDGTADRHSPLRCEGVAPARSLS